MVDSTATDFCSPPRFRRSSDRCRQKTNLPAEQRLSRQQGLSMQDQQHDQKCRCAVLLIMLDVSCIGNTYNAPDHQPDSAQS